MLIPYISPWLVRNKQLAIWLPGNKLGMNIIIPTKYYIKTHCTHAIIILSGYTMDTVQRIN